MLFDMPLEELKTYLPPREEPSDFDAFWEQTLARVHDFPLDAVFEPVDFGLRTVETFDVTFNGYGGQPIKGWLLLPLLLVAALCIFLYTPLILKMGWPEWSPGLGLGALPVIGAYFVQTGEYNWPLMVAAVPSFILVHNLLLINEFPDVEADKKGGRRTLPIAIGKGGASRFFSAMTILVYLWIIGGVIACATPVYCLIALLTLPMAIKAIRGSMQYQDMSKLMPALASNVMVVLITQFLLGIGYILAKVL